MKKNETYIKVRLEKLQNYMDEQQLDVVVIARPENVFYYSGFNPILNSHPAFVLVQKGKENCLLVHAIRHDHAVTEGALKTVQLYGKWGSNPSLAMDYVDAMRVLLGDSKLHIGLEQDYISMELYKRLQNKLHISETEDITEFIRTQRIIKDDYEISCIRKAAHLTDVGVETAISYLGQGYSEAEACTEGQYQMRKTWHNCYPDYEISGFGTSEGGQPDALVVWSMANERIAYGCDCPIHYKPVSGDLVLPMSWARIGGYSAENERVIFVEHLDGFKEQAYDAMLEARSAIFEILRPNTTFEELYFAAAHIFEKNGFGDILPGRTGHGMGLSCHEFPSLTKGNTIPLAKGMVFTVEPGLMTKNWGGVRHSDTVLITEDGYECLTKLDRGKRSIKRP